MAVWEGKKYKLEKSENFEEYMKELGVGFLIRKVGNSTYPTVELLKNEDGTFTLNTISTFKNTTIKFKPGEEFDEETVDGRKVKSICRFEGDTLIHEQAGEKPTTIERIFKAEEMTAIMKINNIICTRIYKVVT
ncbi:probable fatty acid-binding protein [Culicoides brevitarsis]|uniref:probable fatty acid-binding protein n=1 Tax=Culicoides brevitarsis TaxID=469753 RepID=UPI00307B774B